MSEIDTINAEIKYEKLLDLKNSSVELIKAVSELQNSAIKEINELSPEMKESLERLSRIQNEICTFFINNIKYLR